MKALSVRQPWAWFLLHGKDIENRDWPCKYQGQLAIHASKAMTKAEYFDAVDMVRRFDPDIVRRMPGPAEIIRGAIIGTVAMHGFVMKSDSPWFFGPYGLVITDPIEFPEPVYIKGSLGLWEWNPNA